MLTHYYIDESWKQPLTEMKEDTQGHLLHDSLWNVQERQKDWRLTREKRKWGTNSYWVSFWNVKKKKLELHRNGCRFNQNQWLAYLKRVNISWYKNCTRTHKRDEQPSLQSNFFSTVSGHPLSHRNVEMTAKMPDMDNHTATNTVSKPSTSRPGGQTQGLTRAIRQVLFHWAIAPTPFSSFGAGWDVVQTGLKSNEADEIPSMCHCDRIQFLFKKTICRHQLVSHMLCGFLFLHLRPSLLSWFIPLLAFKVFLK